MDQNEKPTDEYEAGLIDEEVTEPVVQADETEPPKRGRKRFALFGVAVLAAATVGYLVGDVGADAPDTRAEARPVSISVNDDAPSPSSLADMVEQVLPSIVNIKVTSVGAGPFGPTQTRGSGSGVIISNDGTILTNNHVVEGAVEVKVEFASGRASLPGTVIGTDPDHDVAVVQVDADDLQPIQVGKSADLRLGQSVVALGYPLGLGPTITQGIVSGLDRSIDVGNPQGDDESLENVLQTDAAINPGNSGGALVDESGRLVGINTAAASASSAENIGFAISIDSVLPVAEDILGSPSTQRGWLGVSVGSVDSDMAAQALGLDSDVRGAYIDGVLDGGPADQAGVPEGAVITELDGDDINSADDLTAALSKRSPDEEAVLTLATPTGEQHITVRLGQAPAA